METKKNFAESILDLCAREKWFEGGDGEAYQKLIAACEDPYFSTRDIAMMIYACSDVSVIDPILRGVEEERYASVDNCFHKIISSQDYAAIHDIFQEEIMIGCKAIAEAITGETYARDSIENVFYESGYHEKFESLAADLVRVAYGFTYESDGTGF